MPKGTEDRKEPRWYDLRIHSLRAHMVNALITLGPCPECPEDRHVLGCRTPQCLLNGGLAQDDQEAKIQFFKVGDES